MEKTRLTSLRSVVPLLLAGLALALFAVAVADAKPKKKPKGPPVGVWAGEATYTSPPEFGGSGGGIEYETGIVIRTARDGSGAVRIAGVVASVRTYCPDPGVRDIYLLESPKHGPKVGQNGGFTFKAKGVTITGSLNGGHAAGRIRASAAGCDLDDGVWEATRRRF